MGPKTSAGETIPIAADHAGFTMKNRLVAELQQMGYKPEDLGPHTECPDEDYPDYAHPLAR
jgi:ribose 5-phosphate isomerase B